MNCFSRELNFHFALLLSFSSPTSFSSASLGIGHHLGAKIRICVLVHRAPFLDSRVFPSSCPHSLTLPHPTLCPSCSCGPEVFLLMCPAESKGRRWVSDYRAFPCRTQLELVCWSLFFCPAEPAPFTSAPSQYSPGGFHCLFMWPGHGSWLSHCLRDSPMSHAFAIEAFLREFLFSLYFLVLY